MADALPSLLAVGQARRPLEALPELSVGEFHPALLCHRAILHYCLRRADGGLRTRITTTFRPPKYNIQPFARDAAPIVVHRATSILRVATHNANDILPRAFPN